VPCHCTAAGKALLAWREAWREEVLEQRLESFTNRTLTGPEWLRRELARTVARGFSIEDREFEPDARGVGAPVFSGTGEAVAAVAVVAPTPRLPAENYGEIGEAVMQAAGSLSQQLRSEGRNQA
jgi:IclR family acetate operon transcriptional repressor